MQRNTKFTTSVGIIATALTTSCLPHRSEIIESISCNESNSFQFTSPSGAQVGLAQESAHSALESIKRAIAETSRESGTLGVVESKLEIKIPQKLLILEEPWPPLPLPPPPMPPLPLLPLPDPEEPIDVV